MNDLKKTKANLGRYQRLEHVSAEENKIFVTQTMWILNKATDELYIFISLTLKCCLCYWFNVLFLNGWFSPTAAVWISSNKQA